MSILIITAVLGGCAASRSTERPSSPAFQSINLQARVFQSSARRELSRSSRALLVARFATTAVQSSRSSPAELSPQTNDSARLVERALQRAGLRFGTDGTVGALYGYMRYRHRTVPREELRPGDVLFFDLHGGRRLECANHTDIVEQVDSTGRVTFVESRNGEIRRSHLHPVKPGRRRDGEGRVLNSFVRPIRQDDGKDARYLAGDLLCAAARI